MIDIKIRVAKTVVKVLAVIDREVVEETLTVYGTTPNSRDFLEKVSKELGMASNGTAEVYRVTGAEVVGTVTMAMCPDVFMTHATIIDSEEDE